MALDSTDRRDFVVKINGEESGAVGATGSSSNANGGNFWRESSYDFWDGEKENGKNDDKELDDDGGSFHFRRRRARSDDLSDPPSKLVDQFLQKQKTYGGEISLDIDLNTSELQSNTPPRGLPAISETSSPYTAKVKADAVRRRQNRISLGESSDEESRHYKAKRDEAEVVKKPLLRRNQTKSRLMDPPTPTHPAIDKTDMRSGRKSGFLGKSPKPGTPSRTGMLEEDEEEDPFLDEDLPDVFKRDKLSIWVLLEW